jgi:hypothetical protein
MSASPPIATEQRTSRDVGSGPSAEVRALIRHHPGDPGPMKFPWYCGGPVEDKYRVVRTLIVLGHFVS